MKVYLKVLYTVVPAIELGNNPYEKCFLGLRFLLNLYKRVDNAKDDDLLQILVIGLPLNKTKWLTPNEIKQ